MKYEDFLSQVREDTGIEDNEEAERASIGTLKALARHLSEGEAEDLAAQLSGPLGDALDDLDSYGERFSLDEFFERAQKEMGMDDRTEAERHARAVVGVMSEAVTRGELTDVFSQLPAEFADLFSPKNV